MNIFSRCFSNRRAAVQPMPEPAAVQVVVESMAQHPGNVGPADEAGDRVGAPDAALQDALRALPQAPRPLTRLDTLMNCLHVGLNNSVRDLISMAAANGSALVLRAGLSTARAPAVRIGLATACVASTAALVGTHWCKVAPRLVASGSLRGSSLAEGALVATPFLLELAALLTPMVHYDADDSWDIAQQMLIIMTGARLANFIRDHVTQAQQGYWGSVQLVTPDELDPTRAEAKLWEKRRLVLQTALYGALSYWGTLHLAPKITNEGWFKEQENIKGEALDQLDLTQLFISQLGKAAPRLAAGAVVEVLDPFSIALSAFAAACWTGLRVRYAPGKYASAVETWRANVDSPQGRADTRERAVMHTGMRMGMQSAVDVATGWSVYHASHELQEKTYWSRVALAVINGFTEIRFHLVEQCYRDVPEPTAQGDSAILAQARHAASQEVVGAEAWVAQTLEARGWPCTRPNVQMLFHEFLAPARAAASRPDDAHERVRTLFTGDISVVAGGRAAFNQGLRI
jgi:hypothetical protein